MDLTIEGQIKNAIEQIKIENNKIIPIGPIDSEGKEHIVVMNAKTAVKYIKSHTSLEIMRNILIKKDGED